jgi:hypothetical protein
MHGSFWHAAAAESNVDPIPMEALVQVACTSLTVASATPRHASTCSGTEQTPMSCAPQLLGGPEANTCFSHALFARASHTHFSHALLTRASHTRFSHSLLTRASHTRFSHGLLTRPSHTAFSHQKCGSLPGHSLGVHQPVKHHDHRRHGDLQHLRNRVL